jgi:lysophospholipase L1-like esterase
MSTKTKNLNLIKPEENDYVNIKDINNNMDIIDEKLATESKKIDGMLSGTASSVEIVTVQSGTIRNNSASDLTFKISSKDNETLKSIKDKSPTVINANVIAKALDGVAINGKGIPSSYNVESTNDEYVITVYSGSSSVVGQYLFAAVVTIAYERDINDIRLAELKNMCIGEDGTVYDNAGDALRGQIGQLKESLEIEKNHTETEYKEEVVQLEITEGQAISTDGELYSSAYARWGKAQVEGLCKIKVSGRSQQNKKYPLILYFDTADKLLGSECGDGTAKNYVDIELTTPLRTAYVKINGAQGTSTSVGPKLTKVSQLTVKEFLNKNNDNLLYGKKIVCIGDSIVKGQGYNGDTKGNKSYVDMIAEKNNMTCINYAVSGATIMSGTNETVFHICDNIETMDEDADYIIVGGGYNDHIYRGTIGSLTDDYTSEITNTSRIIGGTEYMCRKLLERYEGKKILFVFSHKIKDTPYTKINDYNNGSHTMTEVHDAIESVLKKYSMPYCDLYNISCFNTAISSYLKYTANNDGTHPTKEGYEKFYVPYVEAKLRNI